MKNKLIIITTIVFFILSASFLTWVEQKQSDENNGKNWWSIYFIEPKSNNLSFIIENHSNENNFYWEIFYGGNKIKEGNSSVAKGSALQLNSSLNINPENKKIVIQVTSGNKKKEIYKNL